MYRWPLLQRSEMKSNFGVTMIPLISHRFLWDQNYVFISAVHFLSLFRNGTMLIRNRYLPVLFKHIFFHRYFLEIALRLQQTPRCNLVSTFECIQPNSFSYRNHFLQLRKECTSFERDSYLWYSIVENKRTMT